MKAIRLTLLALGLCPFIASANFAEFFGTGVSTQAIGNQANLDSLDPANNYYAPALAAFARTVNFSAFASNLNMDVPKISGIVTKNSTNSTGAETGDANTNYGDQNYAGINFMLPIVSGGTLAVTAIAPLGDFIQTNSGDPRLPEYVLYRSRFDRTLAYVNYAHPLSERWAFSVGIHIGYQVGAQANTQISLNGTSFGSSASGKSKASPSIGAVLSLVRRWYHSQAYLTFQQEMKSNLEVEAFGEVNDPVASLVNVRLDSMLFYDPHIFRLGAGHSFERMDLMASLEYQMWEHYRNPTFRIVNMGGAMLPSTQYDSVRTRNILVPKLGSSIHLGERWDLMLGMSYRPTPLTHNLSGNGNTIDTSATLYSAGTQYKHTFWGKQFAFGLSGQYHNLEDRRVTKTANQENGQAGQKIGSPGYQIGGKVLVGTLGVTVKF